MPNQLLYWVHIHPLMQELIAKFYCALDFIRTQEREPQVNCCDRK